MTRTINTGSAFDPSTGKLYRFDGHRQTAVVQRLWPDPRAWSLSNQGRWFGRVVSLDLRELERRPRTVAQRRWHANLQAAVDGIPPDVLEVLRPLSYGMQGPMLNLLARCPGALELAQSNLALAVALAFPEVYRRRVSHPYRAARRLVRRRRTEILRWLGFPSSRLAVRAFGKVPNTDAHPHLLRRLAMLLCRRPQAAAHLPCLNKSVVRLATSPPLQPYAAWSVLLECSLAEPLEAQQILDDIFRVYDLREDLLLPGAPPKVRSGAEARAMIVDLQAQKDARPPSRLLFGPFPPGPFPDATLEDAGVTLRRVTTVEELNLAGRRDHNCLEDNDAYPAWIARGDSAIYRVRWREDEVDKRAMLHLQRTPLANASWKVAELHAPCNERVPTDIDDAIEDWLILEQRRGGDWQRRYEPTMRWVADDRDEPPTPTPDPDWIDEPVIRQVELPLLFDRRPWDQPVPF